jgi:DNA-binding PadR family transcriptional regulator
MTSKQTNLLQGTLDLLILKALGTGEFHGLGISRRIEQITHGTFLVKPGSLFPALHRMEEAGWLSFFWGESEITVVRSTTDSLRQEKASLQLRRRVMNFGFTSTTSFETFFGRNRLKASLMMSFIHTWI